MARLPKPYAARLAEAMRALRQEPRPPQCKRLGEKLYRIREGEYRIVYAVFDREKVVFVGKVGRRSEKLYRDLSALLARARRAVESK